MPRKKRRVISDMQIRRAMIKHEGHVSSVADELEVTADTIYRRMRSNPKIREYLEHSQEKLIDKALKTVEAKIEDGNLKAAMYVLDNTGKKRGYGSKQKEIENAQEANQGITFNLLDTDGMDKDIKKALLQSLQKQKQKQIGEGADE